MLKEPITGVIGGNSTMHVHEDIANAFDLHYTGALDDHVACCEDEECIELDHEPFLDECDMSGHDPRYLLGFKESKEKDKCWYWFDNLKYGYALDEEVEFSAIYNTNDNVIQVVKSKYVSLCHYCSPCYPNQGNLDTEGDLVAYQLPPDCFDDEYDKPLPIIPIDMKFVYVWKEEGEGIDHEEGLFYEFCKGHDIAPNMVKSMLKELKEKGECKFTDCYGFGTLFA